MEFIKEPRRVEDSPLAKFISYEGQDFYTDKKIVPIKPAIRDQLYEIAMQGVASTRETKINKKARRGTNYIPQRKRKEWEVYEPTVDIMSSEEVDILVARE